ncbi:MAG: histidinol-phosphate transaminase [Tissierellia bacterium]|nr:histidinol-phosphate transaminase [Tissierellia bacterium]
MKMRHGGDITTYSKLYQNELIDFSSNINPLGYPKGLKEFWKKHMNEGIKYPDIKYRKLKSHIAHYLHCNEDEVLVGNGAMEILDAVYNLCQNVEICYPSFGEYLDRAKIRKLNVTSIPLKDDLTVDMKLLDETLQENTIFILGNPNNPTGYRLEKDKLLKIYQMVREREGLLVLDEVFFEFCDYDYDSIELFRAYEFERVVIIRAATKYFALPGVRLGYACTNKRLIEELNKIILPWNVNIFADLAGQYIFNQEVYMEDSKKWIRSEREYVTTELEKLPGIKVYPGDCNFLLIQLQNHLEEEVLTFFLERGILIRTCSSFQGLGNNHIRIAIKGRDDNNKLLEVFREFLQEN